MANKIEYAKRAMSHCKAIKDIINALCGMIDIADETFSESDKVSDYKSIFQKADAWEKQYKNYIENTGVT